MFFYNKKLRLAISMMAIVLVSAACASRLKKAEVSPTANPTEEIAKLEGEIQEGYTRHLDIVDDRNFSKAQSYLNEAKSDLASNQDRKEVLDDVAYGLAYLQAAREKGESRSHQIPAIIEAREKAIAAGARNYPPTQRKIKNLDDDVRSYSKDFAHMSADDIARLQSGYLTGFNSCERIGFGEGYDRRGPLKKGATLCSPSFETGGSRLCVCGEHHPRQPECPRELSASRK